MKTNMKRLLLLALCCVTLSQQAFGDVFTNPYLTGIPSPVVPASNAAATGVVALNVNTSSNWNVTLTGNVTDLSVSNLASGASIYVEFIQDGTGGKTVAWHAGYVVAAGFTVASGANAVTSAWVYNDGTNVRVTGGAGYAFNNVAQSWTAVQTFGDGNLVLSGATSGSTVLKATAIASGTLTLPATTDTLATVTNVNARFSNFVLLTSASSNWTVPAGVTWIHGMLAGAGGGGGAVGLGAAATASGGASGECIEFMEAVTPGALIAYTVGVHGNGGTAGNNNGSTGNSSTFDAWTATGGPGGLASTTGNAIAIPQGTINNTLHATLPTSSVVSIADTMFNGVAGSGTTGGNGAPSCFGWGAKGLGGNNAAGGNAVNKNAGGAGAGSSSSQNLAGGNGGDGAIVILY